MEVRRDLSLKPACRIRLKRPLGKLVSDEAKIKGLLEGREIMTVGDHCTRNLLEWEFFPRLSIVDYKIQRKEVEIDYRGFKTVLKLKNPPAAICKESWETISEALKEDKVLVEVDGEEDLLVLVVILLAPEGVLVCYGQPNEGLVLVEVDKSTKARASRALEFCFR